MGSAVFPFAGLTRMLHLVGLYMCLTMHLSGKLGRVFHGLDHAPSDAIGRVQHGPDHTSDLPVWSGLSQAWSYAAIGRILHVRNTYIKLRYNLRAHTVDAISFHVCTLRTPWLLNMCHLV